MDPTRMGMNRTGVQMSPILAAKQMDLEGLRPQDEPDGESAFVLRRPDLEFAEPVGSVPPPGTITGMVRAGANVVTGHRLNAFVDKLGERLAFERSGTRLYDALLEKCAERSDEVEDIDLDLLREFRNQEASHFNLLRRAIEQLGADPTAQTPCADVTAVASMGLMQVVRDPRTSVAQSLQAVLTAELVDGACWELLQSMTVDFGYDALAEDFGTAIAQEEVHLANVRSWYDRAVLRLGKHAPA
jgi:bacterioferritin (cytochrome b1)